MNNIIRISAIGTQSAHTSNFIRICNLDKAFGDEVRMTALCGNDDENRIFTKNSEEISSEFFKC